MSVTSAKTVKHYRFPYSVDINPTAVCNLHCSFCWGPDHTTPDTLTTEEWKKVIHFLVNRGTKAIVFTGGEPLVRKDIDELVQYTKYLGARVTLSTNTLLLKKHVNSLLPYIDEIGIPIDGSTQEENAKMRLGNPKAFESAINSMQMIRKQYPYIEITVRTVISRVNKDNILAIGLLLDQYKNFVDRWKIYQFTPVSIGANFRQQHELTEEEFNRIMLMVKSTFSDLHISSLAHYQRIGRYVFIGPEGNLFGVTNGVDYQTIGSWKQLINNELAQHLEDVIDIDRNSFHGHFL